MRQNLTCGSKTQTNQVTLELLVHLDQDRMFMNEVRSDYNKYTVTLNFEKTTPLYKNTEYFLNPTTSEWVTTTSFLQSNSVVFGPITNMQSSSSNEYHISSNYNERRISIKEFSELEVGDCITINGYLLTYEITNIKKCSCISKFKCCSSCPGVVSLNAGEFKTIENMCLGLIVDPYTVVTSIK